MLHHVCGVIAFKVQQKSKSQLITSLLPPANEVCKGYVFTPVCQSFCSQGGYLGRCTPRGRYTPPGQVHCPPRGRYTPLGRYTPRQVHHSPWQVHPPWAGKPLGQVHPPAGTHLPRQVHPPGQVHPQAGTAPQVSPWAGTPPGEQCMLGDTGNKRTVGILLECILVW